MDKAFIRDVLKSCDIKAGAFALRLGVKRLALYRWMTGERKWPLDKALLAAELLGIPPEKLQYVRPGDSKTGTDS